MKRRLDSGETLAWLGNSWWSGLLQADVSDCSSLFRPGQARLGQLELRVAGQTSRRPKRREQDKTDGGTEDEENRGASVF